ncbi:MAG: VanZ family protein [Candidatus Aminicenantales bacterium]
MSMKKLVYFLPAALYYALIFFLSSRTHGIEIYLPMADKAAHCLEYAGLALLMAFGFFKSLNPSFSLKRKAALAVSSALILALLDETHQYFVPGRQAEILDLLADSIGAFIGLVAYIYLSRRIKGGET